MLQAASRAPRDTGKAASLHCHLHTTHGGLGTSQCSVGPFLVLLMCLAFPSLTITCSQMVNVYIQGSPKDPGAAPQEGTAPSRPGRTRRSHVGTGEAAASSATPGRARGATTSGTLQTRRFPWRRAGAATVTGWEGGRSGLEKPHKRNKASPATGKGEKRSGAPGDSRLLRERPRWRRVSAQGRVPGPAPAGPRALRLAAAPAPPRTRAQPAARPTSPLGAHDALLLQHERGPVHQAGHDGHAQAERHSDGARAARPLPGRRRCRRCSPHSAAPPSAPAPARLRVWGRGRRGGRAGSGCRVVKLRDPRGGTRSLGPGLPGSRSEGGEEGSGCGGL